MSDRGVCRAALASPGSAKYSLLPSSGGELSSYLVSAIEAPGSSLGAVGALGGRNPTAALGWGWIIIAAMVMMTTMMMTGMIRGLW